MKMSVFANEVVDHPGHRAVGQPHRPAQLLHGHAGFPGKGQQGIGLGGGDVVLSEAALIAGLVVSDELV